MSVVFLADPDLQQAHETEIAHGGEHVMPDSTHVVALEPGETTTIAWRLTEAGTTGVRVPRPGHYARGMLGSIVIS